MAGRGLSLRGRIAAAGVSVAVTGALLGLMAVSDHHADASKTTTIPAATSDSDTGSGTNARPATPYGRASPDAQPEPHTRTGAS